MKDGKINISEIEDWVRKHEAELLDDLAMLVSIRSVSEPDAAVKPYGMGCREALKAMLELGEKYGFYSQNYDYHFGSIALRPEQEPVKKVGIWTHLDVVEEGGGWTWPPYQMTRVEEYLIGRGIQDNKGPVMGALYVLRYLKENAKSLGLRNNYLLYMGCSEENGMQDMDYFISHYQPPGFNLVADCAFPLGHGEKGHLNILFYKTLPQGGDVLEFTAGSSINSIPSEARILLKEVPGRYEALAEAAASESRIVVSEAENGIAVKASGRAKHVGFPEGSINALYVLSKFLMKADILAEEETVLMEFLNKINADVQGHGAGVADEDPISGCVYGALTVVRKVDDQIQMHADYRYPIFGSGGLVMGEKLKKTAAAFGCGMEIEKDSPPYYRKKEDPNVQAVMKTYQRITGSISEPFTISGGTYARKLPNAVSYGMSLETKKIYQDPERMGESGDCHQPDESQHLEQLKEGIVIYIATLAALDKMEEASDE